MGEDGGRKIDARTGLSIGLVVLLFAGVLWIKDAQTNTDKKLAAGFARQDKTIAKLADAVQHSMGDRWRGQEMETWTLRFQLLNPGLNIPDPRDPTKLLQVDVGMAGNE